MVHIRFEGRSYELHEDDVRIYPHLSETQIKERLANYFDVETKRLNYYVVDRVPNDNVIIRPEAVYG